MAAKNGHKFATTAPAGAATAPKGGGFGEDTAFTTTSAGLPGVERSFTSFSSAVQQIEDARIWAGFHYRSSCEDGATLGTDVGTYVLDTLMQPLHRKKTGQLSG